MKKNPGYIQWIRNKVGHEKIILNFVGGCIYNDQGQVLLQRRGDSGRWGFPGGAVELNESVTAAAVREIKEETGLDVQVSKLIGIYSDYEMEYPNGDKAQTICVGLEFEAVGGMLTCDQYETVELRYFALNDIPELFCKQHEDLLSDIRNKRYGVIR